QEFARTAGGERTRCRSTFYAAESEELLDRCAVLSARFVHDEVQSAIEREDGGDARFFAAPPAAARGRCSGAPAYIFRPSGDSEEGSWPRRRDTRTGRGRPR